MTFLSDSELDQLRLDMLDLLPDVCDIERPTSTNTDGYVSESWGTAVADCRCRFDPKLDRRSMQIISERESDITTYIVSVPYDTDVRDGDRIAFNSNRYQITALWEEHSLRAVRRMDVSRIRGG